MTYSVLFAIFPNVISDLDDPKKLSFRVST
jgi:hypothetical protein